MVGEREAWSDTLGSVERLHGSMLEQARQSHPGAMFGDWREYFDSFTVLRGSELDGRNVWVVRLQGGGAPPVTAYVDRENGDLLRSETSIEMPGLGRLPMETRFEDYQEREGVRLPNRMLTVNEASGRTVFEMERLETNVPIDDAVFEIEAAEIPVP